MKKAIFVLGIPLRGLLLRGVLSITIALLFTQSPSFGMESQLEPNLLDKDFIKTLNWDDENLINELTKNLIPYTKNQNDNNGFKDKTILKEANIKIGRFSFTLSLRQYNESRRYEIFALLDPEEISAANGLDESMCSDYIEYLNHHLGQPSVDVNLLHSFLDVASEWEIGSTRIKFSCTAYKIGKDYIPALLYLYYGFIDDIKPMKGVILLKCSNKWTHIGLLADKGTLEKPPITIVIHLDRKKLYSRSIQVGKTTEFSHQEIIAEDNGEKGRKTFRLDRVTGNFTWTVRLNRKGFKNSGLDIWGECNQIPQKQKF